MHLHCITTAPRAKTKGTDCDRDGFKKGVDIISMVQSRISMRNIFNQVRVIIVLCHKQPYVRACHYSWTQKWIQNLISHMNNEERGGSRGVTGKQK